MAEATASSTERPPDRRKLVAVVYADMVGYSRLIGLDDAGTLERLRALRQNLIDPAIAEHSGRIVQTGGDSLLIVFDSVDGAVRCGVKVQQGMPERDGNQPADRAIRFRVGINIGDAIADGTDLHGDAVNVAARLQAECPPGGICVTRPVRDHVQDRLNLAFEELGALSLKNIARPVEAYLIKLNTATVPKSVERSLVQGTGEALPLPDKPSIAVLAFNNMSGDPEQEFFSDGISEDIIAELSRRRSLFVIARNSSFTYKGRAVDVRQMARDLGVRYVLEGSVRRNGGRARIVAQLIEAETGKHIWAERYDRALEDVFAVQDEITSAVVTAIVPALTEAELGRILRKPPGSLGAWEAYQRGLWHLGKANAADIARAKELFHRSTTLDNTFAPACSAMAMACLREGGGFATRTLQEAASAATCWAHRAIEVDPDEAEAHAVLAWASALLGNRDASRARLAFEINPNSSWANFAVGGYLVYGGQPRLGREALLNGLRLSPRDPVTPAILGLITASYYLERDYERAAEIGQRTVSRFPSHPTVYRYLAASLGQLGRTVEAREVVQQAMQVSSQYFELSVRNRPSWNQPEDYEHMMDGLRKAGWQG